jgi:repressor LexA
MREELTEKQARLLGYLEKQIGKAGKTPSLRTMGEDFGVSYSAIRQVLEELEKKHYIRREGRYSRTIHLLNPLGEVSGLERGREIPIVSEIAAGLPLYAQQEWGGTVVVDGDLYRFPTLFALRVKGHSMKDAAILNGDVVVCTPRQYAENGEIVVALVHTEEATVKRFFRHADHIELRPENPAFSPQRYSFDDVLIQGKVVGVQRGPDVMDGI